MNERIFCDVRCMQWPACECVDILTRSDKPFTPPLQNHLKCPIVCGRYPSCSCGETNRLNPPAIQLDWLALLEKESADNLVKVERLEKFVNSAPFGELPTSNRVLIEKQLELMQKLQSILDARIKLEK